MSTAMLSTGLRLLADGGKLAILQASWRADVAPSIGVMESLGDDLVLLSIRDKGTVASAQRIGFGLMGSELVRLAATGRIDIQRGRVLVLNQAPTGDAQLDAALQSLLLPRRPPRATDWVGRPRRRILPGYLDRLVAAGILRAGPRRITGTKYFISDPARAADARARLDAIALSTGMVDTVQAAFGGLASAIDLDRLLYPGRAGRAARRRLSEVGKGQWTVAAVTAAADPAIRAMEGTDTASSAAAHGGTHAATHAATQAATHAATQAATHAAIHAATHAAIQAAHDAGAHGGGVGGHH
jgi:Golgi phosphoprotein 3 (GPP34)